MKIACGVFCAAAVLAAVFPFTMPAAAGGEGETEIREIEIAEIAEKRLDAVNRVVLDGREITYTLFFDEDWNRYFALNPFSPSEAVWGEKELEEGAVHYSGGEHFRLRLKNLAVTITAESGSSAVADYGEIFGALYRFSPGAVFGGAAEYAFVRNKNPVSGEEGLLFLRLDSDGVFWYSAYSDAWLSRNVKWLVAVNGTLYGARKKNAFLSLFSKPSGARGARINEKSFTR